MGSNGWVDAWMGTTNRLNRAELMAREMRLKRWQAACWYAVFAVGVAVALLGLATAK